MLLNIIGLSKIMTEQRNLIWTIQCHKRKTKLGGTLYLTECAIDAHLMAESVTSYNHAAHARLKDNDA